MKLKKIVNRPAPNGFKWVFCQSRRVRGKSEDRKVLHAKDYGYEAWAFLVRA